MESLIEVVISPSLSNLIVKREYRFVFTAEESYISNSISRHKKSS